MGNGYPTLPNPKVSADIIYLVLHNQVGFYPNSNQKKKKEKHTHTHTKTQKQKQKQNKITQNEFEAGEYIIR